MPGAAPLLGKGVKSFEKKQYAQAFGSFGAAVLAGAGRGGVLAGPPAG